MDRGTKLMLWMGPGSVGDTAQAYATSYSKILKQKKKNLEEFNNAFNQVISIRALAYENIGIDDKNLLIPTCHNGIHAIHRILDPLEDEVRTESDISDEEYKELISYLRVDLPTMILYAMLLESGNKREGFAGADREFVEESLRALYSMSNSFCPYQTMFSEDDFVLGNTEKLKLFLSMADSSLYMMIKVSLLDY